MDFPDINTNRLALREIDSALGFVEEGLRRQSGYWKGNYHDLKCFGLLRAEFRNTTFAPSARI